MVRHSGAYRGNVALSLCGGECNLHTGCRGSCVVCPQWSERRCAASFVEWIFFCQLCCIINKSTSVRMYSLPSCLARMTQDSIIRETFYMQCVAVFSARKIERTNLVKISKNLWNKVFSQLKLSLPFCFSWSTYHSSPPRSNAKSSRGPECYPHVYSICLATTSRQLDERSRNCHRNEVRCDREWRTSHHGRSLVKLGSSAIKHRSV